MAYEIETAIPEFLKPGTRSEIGSHRFEPEDIIRFARKFDPQRFHVDEEAASKTMLGGLCASGWQTASVWMKLQRLSVRERTSTLKSSGKTYPEFGPSPGMKHLKWLKPVFAGDTITYCNTPKEFRKSNSRPPWWILRNFSEGFNQNGEKVIEFESTVFVKLCNPSD